LLLAKAVALQADKAYMLQLRGD